MITSIAASCFYALSVSAFFYGFWTLRKTEKQLYGIVWIPVIVITLFCMQVFWAAFINFFKLPVNLITVGIFNCMTGGALILYIRKSGKKQRYLWEKDQLICLLLIIAFTITFVLRRFGFNLELNFATVDPAAHFRDAMNVVNTQSVNNMFYASLNHALFIELLSPLKEVSEYYKFYILAESLHFMISGWMFYGLLQRHRKNLFVNISAIIATFLYMAGYPMNNTLYGFTYLGMGVSVIAYLIYMSDTYINGEIDEKFNLLFLMLGALGIFQSYMLYMPVVFFSIFFCISYKRWKDKCLFSIKTVIIQFTIFLLPCLIGLYYAFFGIFSGDVTVSSAISTEGGIYQDLFSNFLFLMPFAFLGIYYIIKKRKLQVLNFLLPIMSVFTIGMFYFGLNGKVSSYYFYKNYYLIWLLFFLLAFSGVVYLSGKGKEIVICVFMPWLLTLGLFASRLEFSLSVTHPLFVPEEKAGKVNDIYAANYRLLQSDKYNSSKMELFQHVYTNYVDKGIEIPLAGGEEDDFWYQAITNQRLSDHYEHWKNKKLFFKTLKKNAAFVLVLYGSDIYVSNKKYFNKLQKVYENDSGFVASVSKGQKRNG